jgi:serine/threonine protein kinase/tetratricopeptide (TPR) repeat protein
MVDRDGGSGPRTELDLAAEARAALEAAGDPSGDASAPPRDASAPSQAGSASEVESKTDPDLAEAVVEVKQRTAAAAVEAKQTSAKAAVEATQSSAAALIESKTEPDLASAIMEVRRRTAAAAAAANVEAATSGKAASAGHIDGAAPQVITTSDIEAPNPFAMPPPNIDGSRPHAAPPSNVDGSGRHAVPAGSVDASERPSGEHQTLIGGPTAIGTPPPRKPRAMAYAPTAAVSELTANTPDGVPLEPIEELPEGTLLAGRYHITELVGQGGMGAVYAAHDDDLDEDIALKVLRPDLGRDADFQRRLKAEVRLARRVSHPNVCRVHDFGVADDVVFVTMELVRGQTLRERLAETIAGRAQPLELAQIVDIIVQVGAALSAAHRAGVIHRDVKPDNVILAVSGIAKQTAAAARPDGAGEKTGTSAESGRVVLTDFGVASMVVDRKNTIVGTPAYLAPEVLRHEGFDHRVDVYAVSCLAYELIAGAPPFPARTIDAAMKLAHERPTYPELPTTFANATVRSELDRVLRSGLSSDPNLRPLTIERFTDAFAQAARGAPPAPAVTGRRVERLSTQDATTPATLSRRTELRVATSLVWYANRGARDTEEAERIIVDAGGLPIRVAAGEIVALFGATRSSGDDADRAAHSALAIVGKYGGRIGLDTTRILLRPSDTELAGPDSAASAASIAHDAREGQVWASKATARQLAARFTVESTAGEARRIVAPRDGAAGDAVSRSRRDSRTSIDVRDVLEGRTRRDSRTNIDAREALGEGRDGRDVRDVIDSLRAAELATIDAHVERAFRERAPVFVEVRGAAGSGKTRLRKAVMAALDARRDIDWMVAATSPVGEPAPLSLVQSCSAEWYAAVTAGDAAYQQLAARRWLERRAIQRPIGIVVEDLQWADPTSRALLDYLRVTLERVPVAVLTFTRGERSDPAPTATHVVYLAPLDAAQAARVARAIAPAASDTAIATIVQRAGGNPFFVEELAREAASGNTALPTSIEAVVQAHLDQLPAIANSVASAAAVIGHGLWRGAVARLMMWLDEEQLDEAFADLERTGVLAPGPRTIVNDDYFQFSSALVRDVAYARIPARERRQQHAIVAAWLDEQPAQDAQRLLAIAHHREQAGDAARAALAYREAGRRCLDLFAYGEATSALRKASALVTIPDPVLEEALADAVAQTDGYGPAEPIYQRALDETDDMDHVARARLLYKLGNAAARRGNTTNAIARYKAGLAIAAPGGKPASWTTSDPRTLALLWSGLGWTLGYQLGQVEEGHPHCERAVALLEKTPHRRDLAQTLSRLGGTYMRACRFADQLRCNRKNLEIAVELGDLNMQLTANINLGVVYGVLGMIDLAVDTTRAARSLAQRIKSAASECLAASNLAGYYIEQGRLDEAAGLLEEALAAIERTGARYILCESLIFCARIAAARGDLATAREHAERSLATARSLNNQLDAAIALRIVAQLESRAGEHEAARVHIEEALVQATIHDEFEAIRTRAARARILARAGDPTAEGELGDLEYELRRLGTERELVVLRDLNEVR